MLLLLLRAVTAAAVAPDEVPAGYSVQRGDCGYPVCATITPGPAQGPHTPAALAALCNRTDGCEGFNSNGWLKRCLPPRCPEAAGGMEPTVNAWLFTKIAPPKPMPPPPPMAPRPDLHYPVEEKEELSRLQTPTATHIDGASGTAILSGAGVSTPASVSEGAVYGPWRVLAVLAPSNERAAAVVLEHLFVNFGVIRFVGATGLLLELRSSVGVASTPQPRFNFTGYRPDYFQRATEPDDWLAQRAKADSPDGESWYLESWKYLAPSRDYGLLGSTEAGMKWIMNHDGRIKRATQYSTYEPDNASTPLTARMGVILFDPAKHTAHWPSAGGDFSDRKSGYIGRYLRVISHASFDRQTSKGFTMLALSPAASTPESAPSILVRIADVSNSSGIPVSYRYFAISDVNRSTPTGPLCSVPSAPVSSTATAMYTALWDEQAKWQKAFASSMQLKVPYSDRRVTDMAMGVIVGGLSVFLRRFEPNYGTGGYWCVDCSFSENQTYLPGYTMGDGTGCYCHAVPQRGASLPLTALALHGALVEFGLFDEAKAQLGFYFDKYIYDEPQVPGHLKPLRPPPPLPVAGTINATLGVSTASETGCVFGTRLPQTAILKCAADRCKIYTTLAAAEAACVLDSSCRGIDQGGPPASKGQYTLRSGELKLSPYADESSWLVTNAGRNGCRATAPVPSEGDAGRFKWQLINMEGWKNLPAYNCSLADGVTDYGRLIDLFVRTARYSQDAAFAAKHLPKAVAMAELLNGWREMGKRDNPMPAIEHGLIFGPAEHDTCTEPAYFFSVQTWSWRGMYELGSFLAESQLNATFGATLLLRASDFKIDIMRAAKASAIMDPQNRSRVLMLPPTVGRNQTIYKSMTESGPYGGSSYSNFRYWSETLSSNCLGPEYDQALMRFRESHGGTLSGMTRFRGWLDDMPTVGYAQSDIHYDRVSVFLQLLAGHVGGYQSPGTFWSTEQMALSGEGKWRARLGGIVDIDYCVPSSMLPAFMAKWQMVFEDADAKTVYLGRATPRRWWQLGGQPFGVARAPTQYGAIGWEATPPTVAGSPATVVLSLAELVRPVSLAVRVRSPHANQTLGKVDVSAGVEVASVDSKHELIVLTAAVATVNSDNTFGRLGNVTLTVSFTEEAPPLQSNNSDHGSPGIAPPAGVHSVLKSDDTAATHGAKLLTGLPTPGDHDGRRSAALQRAVSVAPPDSNIALTGVYNFSHSPFLIYNKTRLTLGGSSIAPAMFIFQYRKDVLPHDMQTSSGALHPGINISSSVDVTLRFAAIDYLPKARVLFCANPRAGCMKGVGPSGPGITIHMLNSSQAVIEDVVVHAAPYMVVTSFNGEGGHTLRRLRFEPNEPGQALVAEKDGIHESDVRRGITVEDSIIGFLNDDFFNVHSNLLVVYKCERRSCLVMVPHVVPGEPQGFISLLQAARPGDTISFFPLIPKGRQSDSNQETLEFPAVPNQTPVKKLKPLFAKGATIQRLEKITDPVIQAQASAFAVAISNNHTNNLMHFAGPSFAPDCFGPATCPHPVDLWRVTFETALPSVVPNASLAGVNELGSAGARFVGNNFTHTTCAARWKSSHSTIANNSFSYSSHSLTITYLQSWLEGPALISNVSIAGNIFHYGEGVNPIQPNPIDTSGIIQHNNRFVKTPSALRSTELLR
jgi:hypothetical protein